MGSVGSDVAAPSRASLRRPWIVAGVAAVVVLVDQLTKSWAVDRLSPEGSPGIHVVGSLDLQIAFNRGMAFSRGQSAGPIIACVAILIVGAMVWFARSVEDRLSLVLIGMVIGGALGNLSDRVFRAGDGFLGGRVVDWITVHWWPTFNVADSGVVVGGIALAIVLMRQPDPSGDGSGDSDASATSSTGTGDPRDVPADGQV